MRHPCRKAPVCWRSLPPFPTLKADVALLRQPFRQRRQSVDMPKHFHAIRPLGGIVSDDLVLVRIQARNDGCQARPAQTRWDVTICETGTLAGKAIQVWGLDLGVPHESIIGPGLIITQDQDNVWRIGRGGRCGSPEQNDKSEKSVGEFHRVDSAIKVQHDDLEDASTGMTKQFNAF